MASALSIAASNWADSDSESGSSSDARLAVAATRLAAATSRLSSAFALLSRAFALLLRAFT